MNELYETLKNFCFLLWCGYITVMSIVIAFQAEEFVEVMTAGFMWMFLIGISARIYEG
jgi:hypothetical protein